MFEHKQFRVYELDDIPIDCECFVLDERFLVEYEQSWLRMFKSGKSEQPVGYVTAVAVKKVTSTTVEVSWIPDYFKRYHEMPLLIPRNMIRVCVDCWDYDEDPHMFVDSSWFESIFIRTHSIFGFIDAIGVKAAITTGKLNTESLGRLRDELDRLSALHPEVLFITFGDSLLLKSNWRLGYFLKKQPNTYKPEDFVTLFHDLQEAYHSILNMDIYGIITQGGNDFYEDKLYHASPSGNHICLNSLGLPYAHLFDIDRVVREAIRQGKHGKYDLYLDKSFYMTLNRRHHIRDRTFTYERSMLHKEGEYVALSYKELVDSIEI